MIYFKNVILVFSFLLLMGVPSQMMASGPLNDGSPYKGSPVPSTSSGIEETKTYSNPFTKVLQEQVSKTLDPAYTAQRDPILLTLYIVNILLSLIGLGTIALLIYAGARWMTSGGNPETVTEAKNYIKNAIIGLIIITMAYSITSFVIRRLQRVTGSYGMIQPQEELIDSQIS